MPLNKIIKRELQVAFAKDAQPVWFRLVKYLLLLGFVCFFWRSKLFWMVVLVVAILSFALHFWFRYKTEGWTKSYGMWKHNKDKKTEKE